jgi:FkbM family methyltransferase
MNRLTPGFAPSVVFDVGANVGDFCTSVAVAFPEARVFAFEPVPSTFETLSARIVGQPSIEAVNAALGDQLGRLSMTSGKDSTGNYVVAEGSSRSGLVSVVVDTGDSFCRARGIDHVGYLKIDTEGYDLRVIVGFVAMLATQSIDFLEAEVSMNRNNTRHVPFERVKSFLESLQYNLFHIYEMVPDTKVSGLGYMRRGNVVFASSRLLHAHRKDNSKRARPGRSLEGQAGTTKSGSPR